MPHEDSKNDAYTFVFVELVLDRSDFLLVIFI